MNISWMKRGDLIAAPYDGGGWIIKDPLTLQFSHLNETEYQVLKLLDGRASFPELLRKAQRVAPELKLTASDMARFIQTLAEHQLIRQSSGGDSRRLAAGGTTSIGVTVLKGILGILRIQVPLGNPSLALDTVLPVLRFLFSRTAVLLMTITMAFALTVAVLHAGNLAAAIPGMHEFLGPRNLLLLLGILISVKVLHELGHALTARFFGAACTEWGVMLMMFTPVLYTNVTDAWRLPQRQRVLVTLAGILVELIIAAVCTVLWWQAAPGVTRTILLNTMLLCSVNTLLFNGNPLLRFDGYFLLSDLLKIPNLADRSAHVLRETVLTLITGRSAANMEQERRTTLLTYGILRAAYRVFLTIAILKLIDALARQWHLQFLGNILFAAVIAAFVLMPLFSLVRGLRDRQATEAFVRTTWIRVICSGVIFCTLLLIPIPDSVTAPALVQPAAIPVYANLAGRLEESAVENHPLAKAAGIANLQNPDLQQVLTQLAARRDQIFTHLESLRKNSATANSELIPGLEKRLEAADHRLAEFHAEYRQLAVTSTTAGILLSPPARPRQHRADLPQLWFGTPLHSRNKGAWIERGTLLGYVGTTHDLQLQVVISESDIDLIRSDQSFTFRGRAWGSNAYRGRIHSVTRVPRQQLPARFGIAGQVDGHLEDGTLRPAQTSYLVTAGLKIPESRVPPALYSTGRVSIQIERRSLISRLIRFLRQTF